MIFCHANHIAQSVTTTFANSSRGMDSIITNNHVFADGSSLAQTCSAISSSASAQTHLATKQFISECRQESSSLQTKHELFTAIYLCCIT
jgi:hypothetical protein